LLEQANIPSIAELFYQDAWLGAWLIFQLIYDGAKLDGLSYS
jgi:hypothetical protein